MNKKTINLYILAIVLFSNCIYSQIVIETGTTIKTKAGTYIVLQGNYSNAGTYTPTAGSTLKFTGALAQTITNEGGETVEDMIIDKSANNVTLNDNLQVNGTLTLTSGNLALNSNTLTFGSGGSLDETDGNTVTGGGTSATEDLNAPTDMDVGGLGAVITSGANLGTTTVTRGSTIFAAGGGSSIARYYDISPATNTGLDATLVFCYDESELNGIDEANLTLFRSIDGGTSWTNVGGNVDVVNNKITLDNIDAFSTWTAGDENAPLPVELVSFTDSVTVDGLLLQWETATEINNFGFDIEKTRLRPDEPDSAAVKWTKLGFVEGNGTTNSPKQYQFLDGDPFADTQPGDTLMYRLKQIDNDGTIAYYNNIIKIDVSLLTSVWDELAIPKEFALMQNYPNPFNPSTTIKYDLPKEQNVVLEIYNILGARVTTLVNNTKQAGRYSVIWHGTNDYGSKVASGMYIYRIRTQDFNKTLKLLLVK